MPSLHPRTLLLMSLLCCGVTAQAQIYSCEGPNGTRVFSDQKCGTDAKQVQGIATKKRATNRAAKAAKTPPKSAAELQDLMAQCKTGDVKACTVWTHGGGPNDLREQERHAQVACDEGSLQACEVRYCSDGATEECRTRVMQSAKVSGDTWYLRENAQQQDDGSILYKVRCVLKDVIEIRDTTIACSIDPGPQRCRTAKSQASFARLDLAAAGFCSVNPRTIASN
jgi:hypothetical protein